jgi:hypothetical protein
MNIVNGAPCPELPDGGSLYCPTGNQTACECNPARWGPNWFCYGG